MAPHQTEPAETSSAARPNPPISPEQLKSDLDTIRNVLEGGNREHDRNPHRIIIAAANLFFGVLLLILVGIVAAGIVDGLADAPTEGEQPPVMVVGTMGLAILLLIGILPLPSLLAGWGLLKHRFWGTVAAVVSAVINFFFVPFGTALAVYTFWALSARKLPARPEG